MPYDDDWMLLGGVMPADIWQGVPETTYEDLPATLTGEIPEEGGAGSVLGGLLSGIAGVVGSIGTTAAELAGSLQGFISTTRGVVEGVQQAWQGPQAVAVPVPVSAPAAAAPAADNTILWVALGVLAVVLLTRKG